MRDNFDTLAEAEAVAAKLTAETGDEHVAVKSIFSSHYFEVGRLPKVGDEVSYAFNGDYTPCGKIAKISKTLKKITTDTGEVFWRKGNSLVWKRFNTWTLIQGHHYERNPHF